MAVERENRFASAIELQEALEKAISEKNHRANDVENTQQPAELESLHNEEDEAKNQSRLLMQAKTENLLNERQANIETANEISLDDLQSLPTEPLHLPSSVEQSPAPEVLAVKSPIIEVSDTQSSGNSKPELTGTSYLSEIVVKADELRNLKDVVQLWLEKIK